MKRIVPALLISVSMILSHASFAQDSYPEVANRLVELINAGDHAGVESLFNDQMGQALPLDQATEFLKALTAQVGNIERLDGPEARPDGMAFRAHCERGVLEMLIVLDEHNKIAGLTFMPSEAETESTVVQVANRLVELINAGDYSGVDRLFNEQMSEALPPEKATEFFKGLTGRYGKVQKLDEPTQSAGWTVFPAECERGVLEMSVVLDDEDRVAGLTFKPSGR